MSKSIRDLGREYVDAINIHVVRVRIFSGLTGTKYFSKNHTMETFAPIAKLVY